MLGNRRQLCCESHTRSLTNSVVGRKDRSQPCSNSAISRSRMATCSRSSRHAVAYCLPGDSPVPARMLSELWVRGDYDEYGAKVTAAVRCSNYSATRRLTCIEACHRDETTPERIKEATAILGAQQVVRKRCYPCPLSGRPLRHHLCLEMVARYAVWLVTLHPRLIPSTLRLTNSEISRSSIATCLRSSRAMPWLSCGDRRRSKTRASSSCFFLRVFCSSVIAGLVLPSKIRQRFALMRFQFGDFTFTQLRDGPLE